MIRGLLDGKVAVVTGATSGIGAEVVHELAREGAKVVFCGRRANKGRELERATGGLATFVQADVTKRSDMRRVFMEAQKLGNLDFVFANAGIEGEVGPLCTISDDAMDELLDTNVKGTLHTYQIALPALIPNKGTIVFHSSAVSALPIKHMGMYAASKAAVDSIVRVAAIEAMDEGVSVYGLNPYIFESEMSQRASAELADCSVSGIAAILNPCGLPGSPRTIGRWLVRLLLGEENWELGSNIAMDGDGSTWPLSMAPGILADMAELLHTKETTNHNCPNDTDKSRRAHNARNGDDETPSCTYLDGRSGTMVA